ncbi:COX15/CtaA family protein [Rickettsia endosymbiont of Cardiosporidium cionae]|uniref:COX15/CtaA family protein n=1 Tax=Rickettsia endosymbiont of Cardiosporidium cionae TaxID=2777155 RepID=UPI0018951DBE|nr:COX15/CtaA family protein [Rickettsia endosymbiont of Cardiosporidium cionae]KAF8818655.1 heme A synthase [Rickettsia endosymbiont of Cardiosporidium cionae]
MSLGRYKSKNFFIVWLYIMCFMVILAIFVGGLTRLTKSGLSITEWLPISGVIPPLIESDWMLAFNKYKLSPEYKYANFTMDLGGFKKIFWLEFIHRIIGRLIFIMYIIPGLFFAFCHYITSRNIFYYCIVGMLILLQGYIGWYMVKSGLVNNPSVSHYRLALHLFVSLVIYIMLFWQLMRSSFDMFLVSEFVYANQLAVVSRYLSIAIIIVFLQIIIGAFVAGLDAGLVYNTYPCMGGDVIASELFHLKLDMNILNNPVLVQCLHRLFAIFILLYNVFLAIVLIRTGYTKLIKLSIVLLFAVAIQFVLGVLTLIYYVPIILALLHQIGAVILISYLVYGLFLVKSNQFEELFYH